MCLNHDRHTLHRDHSRNHLEEDGHVELISLGQDEYHAKYPDEATLGDFSLLENYYLFVNRDKCQRTDSHYSRKLMFKWLDDRYRKVTSTLVWAVRQRASPIDGAWSAPTSVLRR